MLRTRVMPCLLLKDGTLVKTVKFSDPAYIGDPINAIRIYNEKEVDELVLLDIDATVEKKPISFKTIEGIAGECFMPITYGGGIRRIEEMKQLFSLGIEKVSLNSAAALDPPLIVAAAERFGSQSVVVSIDARLAQDTGYEVWTHGGRSNTHRDPVEFAIAAQRLGAGEVLLTSIDRDGTMEGYDTTLIHRVAAAVKIPVIACGGAAKVQDFSVAVKEGGASAIAAGSMFVFHGRNRAVLINFPPRSELEKVLG